MNRMTCQGYLAAFEHHCLTEKKATYHTLRSYLSELWEASEQKAKHSFTLMQMTALFTQELKSKEKNSTQARKISCLNTFFLFLFHSNALKEPISLKRPPVQLPKAEVVSRNAIIQLLQNTPKHALNSLKPFRDRSILGILYATGIKSMELSAITLQDVDLQNRSIAIRPSRKKQRTVFFGPQTAYDLEKYLSVERPKVQNSSEYLFLSIHKTPLTTRSIQRICLSFGHLLTPQVELTPKILRHSFALHLLERGTSLERVQELLGHATPASTERYIK
ncbi:MAG: Tyrosine recombinase XerC [candidate division TM6 bacterium GW2011_GWF2_43_17]|nr:MAG: Tyrosine recombinase XerC [candidate division TM6 bacterium GW2011_GWF2_43_17]